MTLWQLQTAKAKLSEVIRTVKTKGSQAITLHGQEEAVPGDTVSPAFAEYELIGYQITGGKGF